MSVSGLVALVFRSVAWHPQHRIKPSGDLGELYMHRRESVVYFYFGKRNQSRYTYMTK